MEGVALSAGGVRGSSDVVIGDGAKCNGICSAFACSVCVLCFWMLLVEMDRSSECRYLNKVLREAVL